MKGILSYSYRLPTIHGYSEYVTFEYGQPEEGWGPFGVYLVEQRMGGYALRLVGLHIVAFDVNRRLWRCTRHRWMVWPLKLWFKLPFIHTRVLSHLWQLGVWDPDHPSIGFTLTRFFETLSLNPATWARRRHELSLPFDTAAFFMRCVRNRNVPRP